MAEIDLILVGPVYMIEKIIINYLAQLIKLVICLLWWSAYILLADMLPNTVVAATTMLEKGTQAQLEHSAGSRLKQAEQQLKVLNQLIRTRYRHDAIFLARFRSAEQMWQRYQNAQLAMMYPHVREKAFYGTVSSSCLQEYLLMLVQARKKLLQQWWAMQQYEGEVCRAVY